MCVEYVCEVCVCTRVLSMYEASLLKNEALLLNISLTRLSKNWQEQITRKLKKDLNDHITFYFLVLNFPGHVLRI